MGFYGNHIVPRLIDLAMRNDRLTPYRRRVLSAASGRVLEIGIGSGVNLPFYRTAVRQIIGIEPSPKLLEMTAQSAKRISMTPELIEGTAEALPLDDRSVDTVVTTWTMCSIPDIEKAVGEMHRVLKHTGLPRSRVYGGGKISPLCGSAVPADANSARQQGMGRK
jgi:ubiquinone/menaquinone biosynthesis C-methylase UbiE